MPMFLLGQFNTAARIRVCLALCVCILAFVPVARAVPYLGIGTYTYHQPDGSTLEVKLYGDEFFAYQRTVDGQEVTLDGQTGFWCYASLASDGRSFVSTGIPVVTSKPGAMAENRVLALAAGVAAPDQELPADVVLAMVRAAQAEHRVDGRGVPLSPETGAARQSDAAGVAPGPPSRSTLGTYVSLCILVDFPDQAGAITPTEVDNFCNQPTGYTGFGNACSVNEYYRIQSNGKFNLANIVTTYVRMPNPKTYYDNNLAYSDGKAQELVSTALDILVSQGFDFTALSLDGSGYITSINVFYAGTCSSGWALGLWPHSGGISSKVVDSAHGISASRYQMSDMKTALEIGTFCHENGHMTCQFPDLYSYANNASIAGYYSLMCSGSWGGGDGSHPTNIDPYLKMKAGWADVVEVNSATHIRATLQADRNFFYKFTNPTDSQQYLIIENRDSSGYEAAYGGSGASVAPGRGLAVWQIDETGDNPYSSIQQYGTYVTPYEACIVEASPTASYTPWYSAPTPFPDASDTFYSGHGADPLSDSTSPDLHFWDLSVSATGRTVSSGMVVHSYDAQGPALSFTIGSGAVTSSAAIGLTVTRINAACAPGQNAPGQVFQVFNTGGGTLNYSISDDAAWLACTPSAGTVSTGSQATAVSFSTAGLSVGVYTATITVSSADASNSPKAIPVTLTVASEPVLSMRAFTLDSVPSPKAAGAPFSVTVTAVDAVGRTVADFDGMAILSGLISHTVGTGTSSDIFPMGTWYHDERTQVIYLAGEIGAAQSINSLSLYVDTDPGQTMNAWTIRMKHTALSSYAAANWEGSGWTTVYQASETVASTGWVKFNFSTPFSYDGVNNLMIDFSINNSSYTSDGKCRYSTPGGNRTIYYQTDSGYGDPLTWSGSAPAGTSSARVPNIKLGEDTPVPLTPTVSGSFVSGVWTGSITVPTAATGMLLHVDDASGHTGDSNIFNVVSTADVTPPTGAVVINGNHTATKTPNVALSLTWDDGVGGSGVTRMRFSNDGSTWTAWEALVKTRAFTLPVGDGYKTVRVQYLDKAGNRSAVYSDYIRLDTVPPIGGIIINKGDATTTTQAVTLGLTWADTGSGVTRMRFSDNGSTWTAWESQKASRAHTLPAGLGYHTVRVQFSDAAENYSPVYNDYIKLVVP